MADLPRVIAHVDIDCFFASAEMVRDASLIGKPVVVAGASPRGVVLSPNYEARRFGIRSAMPVEVAKKLCPKAIYLSANHGYYSDLSKRFRSVLEYFTPCVEMVSVDEAFIDLTGTSLILGTPPEAARHIRERILSETSLSCSVGVGSSKTVAKIASQLAKPKVSRDQVSYGTGVLYVVPTKEGSFLAELPISFLPGIGPKSESKLASIGVVKVSDLEKVPRSTLEKIFGKSTNFLLDCAKGKDARAVDVSRIRKSLGHETTFEDDVYDVRTICAHLQDLCVEVAEGMFRSNLIAKTVTLKLKYADFTTSTYSRTTGRALVTSKDLGDLVLDMYDRLQRKGPVRLTGVSVSGLLPRSHAHQLYLLDETTHRDRYKDLEETVFVLRQRYGREAVYKGPRMGPKRQ